MGAIFRYVNSSCKEELNYPQLTQGQIRHEITSKQDKARREDFHKCLSPAVEPAGHSEGLPREVVEYPLLVGLKSSSISIRDC